MAEIATVAAIVGIFGTITSTVGQFQDRANQQRAQSRYEEAQAQALALQRAQIAKQNEGYAMEQLFLAESSEWSAFDSLNKARIADFNADLLLQDASDALALGEYNAAAMFQEAAFIERQTTAQVRILKKEGRALTAEQEATYGGSGFSTTSGSALAVTADTQVGLALDAIAIMDTGTMLAQKARQEGKMYVWQSQLSARRLTRESELTNMVADDYRNAADFQNETAQYHREMAEYYRRPLEDWLDDAEETMAGRAA